MGKSALRIQSADEAEIVFYEAFMHGDAEIMSALWAEDDILCVHPGSGVITGYEAVTRSWRHILESVQGAEIRTQVLSKTESAGLAVHVVSEEIMNGSEVSAVVVATNVFRRYDTGWLMVEHHGSVIQQERGAGRTLQ